jgi:hypothetical protein
MAEFVQLIRHKVFHIFGLQTSTAIALLVGFIQRIDILAFCDIMSRLLDYVQALAMTCIGLKKFKVHSEGCVLITDSTGIYYMIKGLLGAHLAVIFLNQGYFVFAGVKSLDDITPLQRSLPINLKHYLIPIEINSKCVSKTVQIVEASLKSLPPNARTLIGLINNSVRESESLEPLESVSSDMWIRMFSANVVEPFNLINGFLPLLRHCNGRIINIVSTCSNTSPLQGAYAATKKVYFGGLW